MTIIPNSEAVAVAWLKAVTGLTTVATQRPVPDDDSVWSGPGFIEVTSVAGNPDVDLPVNRPVLQLDFWALTPDSSKPPWIKAATLGQIVVDACQYKSIAPITLSNLYSAARVMQATLLDIPRRSPTDEGSFARFTANLQMSWVKN